MPFQLNNVVPWGRSFDEYVAMFDLTPDDLRRPILAVADGPAAFNAELTRRGGHVVSVDPLYAFSADDVRSRIAAVFDEVIAQTRRNTDDYVWRHIASIDDLARTRGDAMNRFLADFERGETEGRYLDRSLPSLDLPDDSFGLALCSHFLFLYSGMLDLDFHFESIRRMCRLAPDVRIYPLLQLDAAPSPHLDAVISTLSDEGLNPALVSVPYEFQRGATHMLRLRRPS